MYFWAGCLKEQGIAVIYISHKLEEVLAVCDRVTALKDGEMTGTKPISEVTKEDMVSMMIGRSLNQYYPVRENTVREEILFEAKKLHAGKQVRNVSFQVHKGEILGMAGLVGAGRSETVRAIFGADKLESGEIYLNGKRIYNRAPSTAIQNKIAIDRTISTDDYTAYTGGDNRMIGEIAADFLVEKIGGKGRLAIIQGTLGTSATNERQEGFLAKMKEYPDIEIISDLSADYKRDQAMKVMEDLLQANRELDAVFCHSDNMTLGALQAIEAAGRQNEIAIIGADGQKEVFDKIKENDLVASIIYPMGGAEAITLAEKILAGETVEKVNLIPVTLVRSENVEELYDQGF